MKQIFTLLAVVAIVANASAQNASYISKLSSQKQMYQHTLRMLKAQEQHAPAKTTATKQRLLATSSYDATVTPAFFQDSTIFKYTGENSSVFNFNFMYYHYKLPAGVTPGYFPYSFNSVDILADSITIWANKGGPNLVLSEIIEQGFTTNKLLNKYHEYGFYMGSLDFGSRNVASYNGQGQLDNFIRMEWNSSTSTWDTTAKQGFVYDGQNKLKSDTGYMYDMGNWVPLAAESYTYDINGNNDGVRQYYNLGTNWVGVYNFLHAFYPNNMVKTITMEDPNIMQPVTKDSFVYDATNTFMIFNERFDYDGSMWNPSFQSVKHLSTQGLPDTFYIQGWNAGTTMWDTFDIITFTYNSYDNPITADDYQFDGTSFPLAYQYKYYYELYTVADKVGNVVKDAGIVIYPNPAKDMINIHWKSIPQHSVTVQLTNITGQLQYTDQFSSMHQDEQVSLASLAPGIYVVSVLDNNGQVLYKSTVVHQ